MIFTGHAELTIDAKQRLAIPAKHRARMTPERDGNAWYCVPWGGKKLMLYTEKRFEEMAEKGDFSLTPDPEVASVASNYFGMCERLETDSAGRINIPRHHQDMTGIGNEVVMVGCGKYLEVWDKAEWENGLKERFAALPALVKKIGGGPTAPGQTKAE
ncbi:MAG: hypothetical protein JSR77_09975 [Planctomycetes bacterium]|nr:hypothetical protein [Planctomycetota bacterium]